MKPILLANPFKTPQFLILFKKWNQILEDEGLKSIENFDLPEPTVKSWHNLKWSHVSPEEYSERKKYYENASVILKIYPFKSKTHRRIWELHCDGLSVRQISQALDKKKFSKTRVHVVIVQIQRNSGLNHG